MPNGHGLHSKHGCEAVIKLELLVSIQSYFQIYFYFHYNYQYYILLWTLYTWFAYVIRN